MACSDCLQVVPVTPRNVLNMRLFKAGQLKDVLCEACTCEVVLKSVSCGTLCTNSCWLVFCVSVSLNCIECRAAHGSPTHTHTRTHTHTHTHTHSVWEPAAIATTPQTFQGQSCGEWNTHALLRLAGRLQFCGCDWLPALFLPSSCPPLVSCHRVSGEELYPVAAAPALSPSSVAVRACERERVSQ